MSCGSTVRQRYADAKCTIGMLSDCFLGTHTGKTGRQSLCEEYAELIREKYVAGLSVERIH